MVLPSVEALLVSGGDERIVLDPASGLNQYGCPSHPDPDLLAFGSSTASVISQASFAAVCALRERLREALKSESPEVVYTREMARVRRELLSGVADLGVSLTFASSGTDAYALAARRISCDRVVMVEAGETGSGVVRALNVPVDTVKLRAEDGMPRSSDEIDAEVTRLVNQGAGHRVLLVMADQSKTGLIAPSVDCVTKLQRLAQVLVDACQFRLAPASLRAYLAKGFMVALTGSKFLTGPAFSAALLLPFGEQVQEGAVNFGLLLRWEAALVELRRFRAVPESEIIHIFQMVGEVVRHQLMNDPHFGYLPVPQRSALSGEHHWDQYQSIFSFVPYSRNTKGGYTPLTCSQTRQLYLQLQSDSARCQLGQPVSCGMRDGVAVSALR
ncbi:MAG: hypothetical protein A2342_05435, partial [Gallionellales bacterium RIFOXYB12_FULL_54_9]